MSQKFQTKHAQPQPQAPTYEKTVSFSQARAIIWQIKFTLNNVNSKKSVASATAEIQSLTEQFGKECDKYLLKELVDQIDLKDPQKPQKDKNEQFKVQILNQELARMSQKSEFLQHISEVAYHFFHDRTSEFLVELTKRCKLSFSLQLLISIALFESFREDPSNDSKTHPHQLVNLLLDAKTFRLKVKEAIETGKIDSLPEYALHKIIYHLQTSNEINEDISTQGLNHIINAYSLKSNSQYVLRDSLSNTGEISSLQLLKDGSGLENLDKANKVLEPWEILLDLGHFATYNYNQLISALSDFKDINEKVMARTLLQLSVNHTGLDDMAQKCVQNTFEATKKGLCQAKLNKDQVEKKTVMQWSVDNLSRLFRELNPHLNWNKVFEALSELDHKDDITLDAKGFNTFIQLFCKSKPQNVVFPLNVILEVQWANPNLQLNFIENCIAYYLEKKDKLINFQKTQRRQETIEEIQGIKDKVQLELLQIWESVELAERLIELSNSKYFQKVRNVFEQPLKFLPEYLLLTLSLAKPTQGFIMLDELLSLLLPQFLGNHINSIPVLQQLWKNNQQLMIRGIYELYKHDPRIMNLSRVLDITQEVKESLIPIVDCTDYYFAVNLGILAGKRDFLHYDVWLQGRIAQIGTPFIKALLKYIKEHVIAPINDYQRRHVSDMNHEALENFKNQVLEKSHFNKEKLCITLEHLQNPTNNSNPLIKPETFFNIKETVLMTSELFPTQMQPTQNSEEIDNAANDYFQRVFSADVNQVDTKITELIEIMQKFKESEVKKEQEIYACMLHSLFDEYRFLHKYPQQYLEKIAKLFGQIIRNKIIDGTLLEIALKFAFEAFRRDGRRQKFGIIVVKQFFEMLPQFPSFFKDIYDIRQNLSNSEPQMIGELERLYETAKANEERDKQAQLQSQFEDEKKGKDVKSSAEKAQKEEEHKKKSDSTFKINETEFLNAFQQNQKGIFNQADKDQSKGPGAGAGPTYPNKQSTQPQDSMQMGLVRTSTPNASQLLSTPSFVPTKKSIATEQTGLSVNSKVFTRTTNPPQIPPPSNSAMQLTSGGPASTTTTTLNLNVNSFRPSNIKSPVANTSVNQQILQFKQVIDAKIQKALSENSKVRIDDIIEDPTLLPPTSDMQENMKHITNTTGKGNFQAKLVELKEFIGPNNMLNLQIFIHYIVSKRIASASSQQLNPLYIDMIKQIGIKGSVECTITQLVEIFKKLMVIDEESFFRVAQRPNTQINPIKICLINIGAFLGGLTVGSNRPILSKELDLKQLLIEGFQQDKLKYVVIFVCRILKEAVNQKSTIFKAANPWINGLLSILKEIKDHQTSVYANQVTDITQEIDGLFKAYGVGNDIQHSGIIKALLTQHFPSTSLQIELSYLLGKTNLIPQMVSSQVKASQPVPINAVESNPHPQPNEIFQRVTVSNEVLQAINKLVVQSEAQVKQMVADSVDSSIVEILPPVVDRSVTIALITTRELVIKDFAYDGDAEKILKAADLIVKNLAGSLALVTCREPLKMSLTTNLRKALFQISSLVGQEAAAEVQNQINDIAQIASKENLELGCKLIKKAVIEKAQKKVREEAQIGRAIEQRKRNKESGATYFRDDSIASQFQDLPPQLQPNPNGLTEPQFQVYEDFARLKLLKKKQLSEQYDANDLGSMLSQIDKTGLNLQLITDFVAKISQIPSDTKNPEYQKLWTHMKKWLHTLCEKFENGLLEFVPQLADVLAMIVTKYKQEDLSKKLTHEFLSLNEAIINNVDLNILLLKQQIISITEWDNQLAMFLKEGNGTLADNVLQFYAEFLKQSIQEQKVLTYNQVPHLMQVVENVSLNKHIGNFFYQILEDFRKKPSLDQQTMLKDYFNEWVIMAYGKSNNQKQDINRFFNDFTQTEFFKDSEMMSSFCKVMVETSIEKALYMDSGEKRPSDRLDFRYIGCFIKLIIVLMKTQNFNKHKFMIKVFEAIQEVMDEDHNSTKANKEFNQKPYYRMLMNLLTAINLSQCFNPQTQQLILISLADLFNKLNPNQYPGFAYSWIELISHKYFMPHFLKASQGANASQFTGQQVQNQTPTQKKGPGGQIQSTTDLGGPNSDNIFFDKYFRFKDLIVNLFSFLKMIMVVGSNAPPSLQVFYQAALRVCLVILHDYPEFFCDFHFDFVNSLPEQCIQLRNIILSAFPSNIQPPNPFQKNLKVDLLQEVKNIPKIMSNYDNYLQLMNLREDLESYVRTKNDIVINTICEKMMQSEDIINGQRKIHSNVINAVVLFIANQAFTKQNFEITHKESMELFKQIALKLNNETRWCLLNSIVNELRYPNNHTYFFSCIILYLFNESYKEVIQEQISRILFERLQVNRPQPWGLMITFRELIQNPKYSFMKKNFIMQNQAAVDNLFATRLELFRPFISRVQNQAQ